MWFTVAMVVLPIIMIGSALWSGSVIIPTGQSFAKKDHPVKFWLSIGFWLFWGFYFVAVALRGDAGAPV